MRNCIMYVKKVEFMVDDYIYHGTCQCRFIRWEIKKRIGWYAHFMIKYVGMEAAQPYRLLVSDKMYIMAVFCQCFSQFCSQHTTTTKSGIANNSYIHCMLFM